MPFVECEAVAATFFFNSLALGTVIDPEIKSTTYNENFRSSKRKVNIKPMGATVLLSPQKKQIINNGNVVP